MQKVSEMEIRTRIAKLQELLGQHGLGGAVLLQRVDLLYFSGTGQNAHLYIPAQGEPTLLVRKSLTRAKQDSPLDNIVQLNSLKDLPAYIKLDEPLGMELDVLPVNLWQRYKALLTGVKIQDVSGLIKQVRMIKSEFEIAQMRKAAAILNKVWLSVPEVLHKGMSEVALAGKLEAIARAEGSQGFVRMRSFNQEMNFAHLFSGANAAVPSFFDGPTGGVGLGPAFPHGPSLDPIVPGTPIVFDMTLAYNGYLVDQTRIGSLGPVDPFFREKYQQSLELQALIMQEAKPGVVAGELYQMVLQRVEIMGLSQNFMGYVPEQAGFVAHGVGLELDESPVLAKGVKTTLAPGMVFAAEPKFTFPDRGVVGIENTFLVTPQGVERITFASEEFLEV